MSRNNRNMVAEKEGFKVYVDQDEFAENPRTSYDHLGTMLYTSSRYNLGDKQVDKEEIEEIMKDPNMIYVPVFAYIHSGVTLSAGDINPYSCRWDSGMCGIIYCSREDALKAWSPYNGPTRKVLTKALREKVKANLELEVKEFSQYCEGDVWSYSVEDFEGNPVDSCSGFFGYDFAKSQAKDALDSVIKDAEKQIAQIKADLEARPSMG